jgi:hypothetical protein
MQKAEKQRLKNLSSFMLPWANRSELITDFLKELPSTYCLDYKNRTHVFYRRVALADRV